MSETFERLVEFTPAFDKRNPEPSKNYGIHGVEMRMLLKGERGAVQFLLFTNWQLPHVTEEFKRKMERSNDIKMDLRCFWTPTPADLGYHSPEPQYPEQTQSQSACPHLDGRPCYYDGSGLQAEPIYRLLLTKGSEGVWAALEERYHELFSTVEATQ